MPFAMNFTDVRLDEATGTLTAYGESDPGDDPSGLAAVEEVQAVVFAEQREGTCLWQRLREPETHEWSVTFKGASPYGVGQRVNVVGIAVRPAADPFAWSNLLEIKTESEPFMPGLEAES